MYQRSLYDIGQDFLVPLFMMIFGIYVLFQRTPVQIFVFFWEMLLVMGTIYILRYQPYKAYIENQETLVIFSLTKKFVIPISKIERVRISRLSGSVYIKKYGFPFGIITFKKNFPMLEDKETTDFLENLKKIYEGKSIELR